MGWCGGGGLAVSGGGESDGVGWACDRGGSSERSPPRVIPTWVQISIALLTQVTLVASFNIYGTWHPYTQYRTKVSNWILPTPPM